jgi:hypothetical protein
VLFDFDPTFRNIITELFLVSGTTLTSVSFSMKDAKTIRRVGFVRSPVWLIYDLLVFSVGGVLCEVFSIASIITATIRLDMKKKGEK